MTGLYVHIPYCHTKCGYCDFFSVPLSDQSTAPVVSAIIRELHQRELPAGSVISTVFVGGGTPTVLEPDDFEYLFGALREYVKPHAVIEFTTEANPATVNEHKISVLVESGVNRVSLGGQSFHRNELQVLERLHDPADIAPGVHLARAGGIAQINLDLIFGIPGQTMDSWSESLQRALSLELDHLACYGLTYEPQTPLRARLEDGQITPCDNSLEADMYLMCIELLAQHGYVQYEISNFARPGCECRHNLIYWNNGPYIGVGPSAASYLSGVRTKNTSHMGSYIERVHRGRAAFIEQESLTGLDLAAETAMLQLRLNRGIDIAQFRLHTSLDPVEVFAEALAPHVSAGRIVIDDAHIRLTSDGRLLADQIIRDLLPEQATEAANSP